MTVTLRDNADVLDPKAVWPDWPFDVNVITDSYGSAQELDQAVSQVVTGPRVVAIGLDPTHAWTSIHFGTGLSIPSDQWSVIRKTGNPAFKAGNWTQGVELLGNKTAEVLTEARITTDPKEQLYEETAHVGWFLGGIGIALSVIVFWAVGRKNRQDHQRLMAAYEDERRLRDLKLKSQQQYASPFTQPRPTPRMSVSSPSQPTRTYSTSSTSSSRSSRTAEDNTTSVFLASSFSDYTSSGGDGGGGGGFDGGGSCGGVD